MSDAYIAELAVKDLALVSELRLELGPGLTVLTGETGAGKSMLVDAVLAVTGARVGSDLIRDGAERARVEAVFARPTTTGPAGEAGDELILTREIQPGRAPARINGETVRVAKLAEQPVLVFDEVDTGIGGRLGEIVGRALWTLGGRHQVLCVSHLAQVAAYADTHVRVAKEVRGGRTHVTAERLGPTDAITQLAAMLGAGDAGSSLAAGARELHAAAATWKRGAAKPARRETPKKVRRTGS